MLCRAVAIYRYNKSEIYKFESHFAIAFGDGREENFSKL
jgi:hypothetical protein